MSSLSAFARRPSLRAGVLALVAALVLPAAAQAGAAPVAPAALPPTVDPTRLALTSVSNPRPDMVSDEQVLVRVTTGQGVDPAAVKITRNGRSVVTAFVAQPDGSLLGLVPGLSVGANTLQATGRAGRVTLTATLAVTDHPKSGPIFSGTQQSPFVCRTEDSGLGKPVGPTCDARTRITYRYKNVKGGFRDIKDPNNPPADAAMVTVNGRTVPYVARLEEGVMNRAIYQFAVIWDGRQPTPTAPDQAWNGRLVYTYGGGCNGGYTQGLLDASGTGPNNDLFLTNGYAVATSTLNTLGNNCGPVLSAETTMMVKERFIETYGPVTHTIGWGGSGGGLQQFQIADNYPGLLDGIIPSIGFPNAVGNQLDVASDCTLLDDYLGGDKNPGGPDGSFSLAQKTAIAGFLDYGSCIDWDTQQSTRITAVKSCIKIIPTQYIWDPVTNPNGIKCSAAAANVNQLGVDPATGFPNGFVDNVGVQYGLAALLAGQISPGQFAELNAGIGGFDYTGARQDARSVAGETGLENLYASNLFLTAGLGLASTPVIDLRTYVDPKGTEHTAEWSYVIRQRMLEAGTADNEVLVELDSRGDSENAFALDAMNRWLDNISADTAADPLQQKIPRDKPAGLGNGCFLGTPAQFTLEDLTYQQDTGPCSQAYPVMSDPRLVAGQPLDMGALKCQLTPLDPASYPGITFSDTEWAQLQQAFPDGVCDWTQPGVGQVAPRGTWQVYPS